MRYILYRKLSVLLLIIILCLSLISCENSSFKKAEKLEGIITDKISDVKKGEESGYYFVDYFIIVDYEAVIKCDISEWKKFEVGQKIIYYETPYPYGYLFGFYTLNEP